MDVMTAFNANGAYGTYGRRDRIAMRRGIIGCGAGFTVALDESGSVRYVGDNRWGQREAVYWQDMMSVHCGPDYVLGLCRDGAVLSAGRSRFYQIRVENWACVTAISCGQRHAAALISNGQILTSGDNQYGQCDTGTWTDMVDVCCGKNFTVGLQNDGKLLVAGGHKGLLHALEKWQRVAALFSDEMGHEVLGITFGEGRLISTGSLPLCTKKWRNLVYVAASARGVVGITATGRLLSSHKSDERHMENLQKDYLSCAMGAHHMAVLCRNGEVVTIGNNDFGQSSTARWGSLFQNFEVFNNHRAEDRKKKEYIEKLYQQRLSDATRFTRRISCGERLTACIQADGHVSATAGLRHVKHWRHVCALSCGSAHMLALHKDGRVSADGNNVGGCCRVDGWRDVKDVLAGKYHSLGLRYDGTVLFAGWDIYRQGKVTEWQNIRLIRGSDTYTVGLSVDGKIHAVGKDIPFDPDALDMNEWSDLLDIAVSEHHMVGLRKDGRVVSVGDSTCMESPAMHNGEPAQVSSWRGVRAIAVGEGFTVGLCYGGHVVAAGRNHKGQCDTNDWRNVVAVDCGRSFTAALLADGRVVTAGEHKSDRGQMLSADEIGGAVMSWEKAESTGYEPFRTQWMTDVLTLRCGREHLVTVDRYGQVMAEGLDLDGQCTAASTFVLFRDFKQLDGSGVFTTAEDLADTLPEAKDDSEEKRASMYVASKEKTHASVRKKRLPQVTCVGMTRSEPWGGSENLVGCRDPQSAMARVNALLPWDMIARNLLGQVGQGLLHRVYLTDHGEMEMQGAGDFVPHKDVDTVEAAWVACGSNHTEVVTADGRFCSYGKGHDGASVSDLLRDMDASPDDMGTWSSVSCGPHHTAVVKTDGHVLAVGRSDKGQCDTQAWENVIMAACGAHHTVGLTVDGHACATGDHTHGQCDVQSWDHLAMIACGEAHTVGLCTDGRVVAVGDNRLGQCAVDKAKNIISIACLPEATICVKADGNVSIYGGTGEFAERLATLRNVVAVYACEYRISAMTVDGRIWEIN